MSWAGVLRNVVAAVLLVAAASCSPRVLFGQVVMTDSVAPADVHGIRPYPA